MARRCEDLMLSLELVDGDDADRMIMEALGEFIEEVEIGGPPAKDGKAKKGETE